MGDVATVDVVDLPRADFSDATTIESVGSPINHQIEILASGPDGGPATIYGLTVGIDGGHPAIVGIVPAGDAG
jgi:hypothetical protein